MTPTAKSCVSRRSRYLRYAPRRSGDRLAAHGAEGEVPAGVHGRIQCTCEFARGEHLRHQAVEEAPAGASSRALRRPSIRCCGSITGRQPTTPSGESDRAGAQENRRDDDGGQEGQCRPEARWRPEDSPQDIIHASGRDQRVGCDGRHARDVPVGLAGDLVERGDAPYCGGLNGYGSPPRRLRPCPVQHMGLCLLRA
jgi:hypothetical protein